MNCLVTGGAGFIGSHLVDRLVQDGHQVTVIDNFSTGKLENLKGKKLKLIKRDVGEDLDSVFKEEKFDVIFHLAALPLIQFSIENPLKTNSSIANTINLLELARKHKVKRFIFSSSSAVYGNRRDLPFREDSLPQPSSPYGIQKLCCEHYCRFFSETYGLETIIFRLFSVYGPRQSPNGSYGVVPKFIKLVSEGGPLRINGDGNQSRDFIYISDVVEALTKGAATQNPACFGETFNIGTGEGNTVNKLVQLVTGNIHIEIVHDPEMIEQKHTQAEISKAKEFLDWQPIIGFPEGIKLTTSDIVR